MEQKDKKRVERDYADSALSVVHFIFGLMAIAYSLFLISVYPRLISIGTLLTLVILFLYLWSMYAVIPRFKEGKVGTGSAVFGAIGGFFLLFFANIFACVDTGGF